MSLLRFDSSVVIWRRKTLKTVEVAGLSIPAGALGGPLARQELKVILEELARRLPTLRLVPDQTWVFPTNTSFRGPSELSVQVVRNRGSIHARA